MTLILIEDLQTAYKNGLRMELKFVDSRGSCLGDGTAWIDWARIGYEEDLRSLSNSSNHVRAEFIALGS